MLMEYKSYAKLTAIPIWQHLMEILVSLDASSNRLVHSPRQISLLRTVSFGRKESAQIDPFSLGIKLLEYPNIFKLLRLAHNDTSTRLMSAQVWYVKDSRVPQNVFKIASA